MAPIRGNKKMEMERSNVGQEALIYLSFVNWWAEFSQRIAGIKIVKYLCISCFHLLVLNLNQLFLLITLWFDPASFFSKVVSLFIICNSGLVDLSFNLLKMHLYRE